MTEGHVDTQVEIKDHVISLESKNQDIQRQAKLDLRVAFLALSISVFSLLAAIVFGITSLHSQRIQEQSSFISRHESDEMWESKTVLRRFRNLIVAEKGLNDTDETLIRNNLYDTAIKCLRYIYGKSKSLDKECPSIRGNISEEIKINGNTSSNNSPGDVAQKEELDRINFYHEIEKGRRRIKRFYEDLYEYKNKDIGKYIFSDFQSKFGGRGTIEFLASNWIYIEAAQNCVALGGDLRKRSNADAVNLIKNYCDSAKRADVKICNPFQLGTIIESLSCPLDSK